MLVKIITDKQVISSLYTKSLIQKFDDNDESVTDVLSPSNDFLFLKPKTLKIHRFYGSRLNFPSYVDLNDHELSGKIKLNTFIYAAECEPFNEGDKYEIKSLEDNLPNEMNLTFSIFSADIDEPIFYSGCSQSRGLSTDIFLNHNEFQKLENAIEKQNLSECFVTTSFLGLYTEDRSKINTPLFYLSEEMFFEIENIKDACDDFNYGNEIRDRPARYSESMRKPPQSISFSYAIKQKI